MTAIRSKRLFALSAALVAMACVRAPVLAPYPLLALCVLAGWRLPSLRGNGLRLLVATLLSGCVLEIGAWAHNFLRDAPEPALFHPQLLANLLMAVGFYAGWWLAWWWRLRHDTYSVAEVFWVTAAYGVFIEQQGQVFLQGLGTLPVGALLWAFVALSYGSTMALAYVLAGGPTAFAASARSTLSRPNRRWHRLTKYLLPWLALFVTSWLLMWLWNIPLWWLDILPERQLPMRSAPFW